MTAIGILNFLRTAPPDTLTVQSFSQSALTTFVKTLIQNATRITSTGTGMSTRITTCLLEDGIG